MLATPNLGSSAIPLTKRPLARVKRQLPGGKTLYSFFHQARVTQHPSVPNATYRVPSATIRSQSCTIRGNPKQKASFFCLTLPNFKLE